MANPTTTMEKLVDWFRVHLAALPLWLETHLLPWGPAGLVVIAFLDSSFVSIPEVNDILVMSLSVARPEWMPIYALSAAFGSILGCAALHTIGKRGGRRLIDSKLGAARAERLAQALKRFDVFFVLVPSLLPPPCPFKIFVLASGVFGMSTRRFIAAVAVGRSTRYLVEGWIAITWGAEALEFVKTHPLEVSAAALGVGLLVALVWRFGGALWRRKA